MTTETQREPIELENPEAGGAGTVETICWLLRQNFTEKIGTLPLSAQTRLREEVNFDSLDLITFAAVVENHYGCPVLDEETTPSVFATVGSFAEHLLRLRAKPAEV